MKIIGFSITSILAERKEELKGQVNINSNLNVDKITEEKLPFMPQAGIKFEYVYSIDYLPNIASVKIKGTVLALIEEKTTDDVIKNWNKKDFDSTLKLNLYNFILSKCNLKAINLEDDLTLPSHIPFPQLSTKTDEVKSDKKSKPANYTG
jgi:hypothetical protein